MSETWRVLFPDIPADQDINGLAACPGCGTLGEVRAQTPPDDDDIVRRAYFRCFECGITSPDYPGWQPCHWTQTGKAAFSPLRDFWNEWVTNEHPTEAAP